MVKTDNQKYANRGRDMVLRRDHKWEDDVKEANRGREGAPIMHSDTLFLWAAAFRCAYDAKYGQLEGTV